jgi:hypothetical protein
MPCFDMVVVGSGGGPDETNLSAYVAHPKFVSQLIYIHNQVFN